MPDYQHTIDIQVKFQTFEEAETFLAHLHGSNDVLGQMEDGIYVATGQRPHVDVSPGNEDFLVRVVTSPGAWK